MKIDYRITNPTSLNQFLFDNNYSNPLIKNLSTLEDSFMVNNNKVTIDYNLNSNDLLTVLLPDEVIHDKYIDEDLDVVYEDDYLLVINKPAPLAVIGTFSHYEYNLSLLIANYYRKNNIKSAIHLINRLDKDTTGLMMVAKHQYIHHLFSINVAQIRRKYLAIIKGVMDNKEGKINLPIKKKEGENEIRRMVDDNGKNAVTYYNMIDTNYYFSLLDIELQTGRTHQIRVHFSHLNHPLVGDNLYGSNYDGKLRLQSYYLSFTHPIYKNQIDIILPKNKLLTLDSLNLSLDYLPSINAPIYQRIDMFRINSDTSLLGNYIKTKEGETVLDIGTNNGALLLYASQFKPKLLIGVDLFNEAIELADINLKMNKIDNYLLINKAIQEVEITSVDVIISNPPYFKMVDKLDTDQNSFRFIARHELKLTLEEIFIFVNKSLALNGRFYLINRLSRLEEVKNFTTKYQLEITDYQAEEIVGKFENEIRVLFTIKKVI